MTTRTSHSVICSCGHVGAICKTENDQPYSKPWEKYTLENLNGGSFYVEGFVDSWEKIFQELKPACSKCGKALSPSALGK